MPNKTHLKDALSKYYELRPLAGLVYVLIAIAGYLMHDLAGFQALIILALGFILL